MLFRFMIMALFADGVTSIGPSGGSPARCCHQQATHWSAGAPRHPPYSNDVADSFITDTADSCPLDCRDEWGAPFVFSTLSLSTTSAFSSGLVLLNVSQIGSYILV